MAACAVEPSAEFERFVDLLGTRIKLKSWAHFRAGLDTKSTLASARFGLRCVPPASARLCAPFTYSHMHIHIHLHVVRAFSYSFYCAMAHNP